MVGTGSSVPSPIYNRWAREYGDKSPNRIRYLPLGASEGLMSPGTGIKIVTRSASDNYAESD